MRPTVRLGVVPSECDQILFTGLCQTPDKVDQVKGAKAFALRPLSLKLRWLVSKSLNRVHDKNLSSKPFNFSVLEESFEGAGLSPRLEKFLRQAFTSSRIEERRIDANFLETLMDALDILREKFPKGSADVVYLEKLISSIFSFCKLIKQTK